MTEETVQPKKRGFGMQFWLVLVLVLALLVAIFALQNKDPIAITIFFWHFNVSAVLVILGSALAGALAMLLAGFCRRQAIRRKREREAAAEKAGAAGAGSPETGQTEQVQAAAAAEPPKQDG